MDASNSTPTGNDQNPAQNLTAAQQPIAHQVAQQNSGSSNGVPQQPLASNSPAPLNNANIGSNNGAQNGALNGSATGGLQCEWIGCGQRAGTAEQLYEHVCEVHVGRRSTNNLNLQCAWGSCRTATVKRDHITSHIRVHVPLKPHVCHACSKKFKRPQDLKKHVKTHADDHDNQDNNNNSGNRSHGQGQYGGQGQRVFYSDHPVQPAGGINYPFQGHGGQANYYAPTQQQQSGGGNGYTGFYNVDPSSNSHGSISYHGNSYSTESRKRGVDVMNDFFGDAKRGKFDPSSYSEVGQRLLAFNGVQLPLPIHGGGNGGMLAEYLAQQSPPTPTILQAASHRGSMGGGMYGPSAQAYQALPPMPNIRSKRDLQVVDDILDQTLQAVYNNMPKNQIAMHTPQAHGQRHSSQASVHGLRHSNSPPGMHLNTHAMAQSIHGSTPALTPSGSTVQSQSSGHSPTSNHDADLNDFEASHVAANMHNQQMMGQPMRNNSHTVMYPSLPSANNGQGGYNVAPSANLGTHFDREIPRRQGGGRLGRARPADDEMQYDGAGPSTEGAVSTVEDGNGEPAKKKRSHETKEARFSRLNIDPNLDPALAGPAPSTSSTTPSATESEPGTPATAGGAMKAELNNPSVELMAWQMELLLNMRRYVKARLEMGEWEGGADGGEEAEDGRRGLGIKRETAAMGEGSGQQGLYPQLSVGGD